MVYELGGEACGVFASTTGASSVANIQPLIITFRGEPFAVGHNGNLTNAQALKHYLTACFSGHYPTPIEPQASKAVLETRGPARAT